MPAPALQTNGLQTTSTQNTNHKITNGNMNNIIIAESFSLSVALRLRRRLKSYPDRPSRFDQDPPLGAAYDAFADEVGADRGVGDTNTE